jgi:hypothetical protein
MALRHSHLSAFSAESARYGYSGQEGSSEVGAVTGGAGRFVRLRIGLMTGDPCLSYRVKPVRTEVVGQRHVRVTEGAFCDLSGVSLTGYALDVVVGMSRGIFGVGRTVAGFALNSPVAGGELV